MTPVTSNRMQYTNKIAALDFGYVQQIIIMAYSFGYQR